MQQWQVAPVDGEDEQAAEAGIIEDVLDHDQAAQQPADADGGDRDRGQERVGQHVPRDDGAPRQAFEHGSAHVGLLELGTDAGARVTRDVSEQHE